jgi:hypothetical protein
MRDMPLLLVDLAGAPWWLWPWLGGPALVVVGGGGAVCLASCVPALSLCSLFRTLRVSLASLSLSLARALSLFLSLSLYRSLIALRRPAQR